MYATCIFQSNYLQLNKNTNILIIRIRKNNDKKSIDFLTKKKYNVNLNIGELGIFK